MIDINCEPFVVVVVCFVDWLLLFWALTLQLSVA